MKVYTYSNRDQMPLMGLGTWKSNDGEAYRAVREAIRIGYRHLDCASRYENEAEIGQALGDAFAEGDVEREQLWVTSKLWNNAHYPDDVRPALVQTLTDLRLDYLDLYLMHWPVAIRPGMLMPASGNDLLSLDIVPLSSTWQAMEACCREGLVRHIGLSNFSISKTRDILTTCQIRPENMQVESHPFMQQEELLSFCQRQGLSFTAYSPLGSQDRPPRVRGVDEPVLLEHTLIRQVAQESGLTPGQVLIAWAITRGTSVIPKSANPERLRQNFAAASVTLHPDHMALLHGLERGFRYVSGSLWTVPDSPYSFDSLWS